MRFRMRKLAVAVVLTGCFSEGGPDEADNEADARAPYIPCAVVDPTQEMCVSGGRICVFGKCAGCRDQDGHFCMDRGERVRCMTYDECIESEGWDAFD